MLSIFVNSPCFRSNSYRLLISLIETSNRHSSRQRVYIDDVDDSVMTYTLRHNSDTSISPRSRLRSRSNRNGPETAIVFTHSCVSTCQWPSGVLVLCNTQSRSTCGCNDSPPRPRPSKAPADNSVNLLGSVRAYARVRINGFRCVLARACCIACTASCERSDVPTGDNGTSVRAIRRYALCYLTIKSRHKAIPRSEIIQTRPRSVSNAPFQPPFHSSCLPAFQVNVA